MKALTHFNKNYKTIGSKVKETVVEKFAWWPTRMRSGKWVCFKKYVIAQTLVMSSGHYATIKYIPAKYSTTEFVIKALNE